jgi:hypothetical protein
MGPANIVHSEPIGEGQIEHKRGMAIQSNPIWHGHARQYWLYQSQKSGSVWDIGLMASFEYASASLNRSGTQRRSVRPAGLFRGRHPLAVVLGAAALAAGLFAMPVVAEDSPDTQSTPPQTTATVTDTTERVECNAVAVIVSGRRVPGFEATARGPDGATACRVALQQCQSMLENARESTGLDLPSAECQPLETVQLIPDPVDATETAAAPGSTDNQDEAQRVDPSCNINVCSQRYRSFRASDCTFQPYNGPRRRCRF